MHRKIPVGLQILNGLLPGAQGRDLVLQRRNLLDLLVQLPDLLGKQSVAGLLAGDFVLVPQVDGSGNQRIHPGREAYPGDVFYLHSRLLERAARVNEEYVEKFTNGQVKGKTGSLTALPVIETQAGDVSAFVPTNVISITDGQIFLETDLFNAGIRPAINAGISVSRVGGSAQTKVIKKLGGGVRLALAQYRELAAFAQFASDLDEATRKQLDRGRMVTELMKQPQYQPLQVWEMALTLFAVNNGYFDDIDVKKALSAERAMRDYVKGKYGDLVDRIESTKDLSKDDEAKLHDAIKDFKKNGSY